MADTNAPESITKPDVEPEEPPKPKPNPRGTLRQMVDTICGSDNDAETEEACNLLRPIFARVAARL